MQEAMLHAMNEGFGNPSSSHSGGETARRIITQARDQLASLIGSFSNQIFFTSGATESNNWVISSFLDSITRGAIVTTQVEHSSVKEFVQKHPRVGARVIHIPVSRDGLIQVDKLNEACSDTSGLVCIQWVNNETGVVQPIEQIVDICNNHGMALHIDGSQAVGKLDVDVSDLDIDFLTFTAHKFHGPQGVGALFCRHPHELTQQLYGGDQELGLRPGTENLPGIAGFGQAAELRKRGLTDVSEKLKRLRDEFERRVMDSISGTNINGSTKFRVCNTTNIRFDGVDGQALVARLDYCGVQCSQSSACTSHIPESSYVLRAMGFSEAEAYSSVRFSFSEMNTFEHIDQVVKILVKSVHILRNLRESFAAI